MPRLLELYSGERSIGRAFEELGWVTVSVDCDRNSKPTICVDLLQWGLDGYEVGDFDVIWARLPCTRYTCSLAGKIFEKTLEIIAYFEPRWWWLENSATGLIHERPYLERLGEHHLVSSCNDTRLWTNNHHVFAEERPPLSADIADASSRL